MATNTVSKPGSANTAATSSSKDAPSNPRGIPYAPFVDRVEDYVTTRADVEPALKNFQEMISKYQFMEANTSKRAAGLKDKIPDISKTLETVRFLEKRQAGAAEEDGSDAEEVEPLETHFELNDTLFAKAHVPATKEVYLWLGANVMLSYPLEEAEALLAEKLGAARRSLQNCEEDLEFLREQITTMEVATARVYNWDVGMRRKEKADGKGGDDEEQKGSGKG